mmetsp:Transcript_18113/g.57880  ORF Transcript_18113/g.57880 Transcript_18113/m.57880 type:complete len:154 (-) Transcript_18113:696-1157(-)
MNGVMPCRTVLDDATAAQLRGTAESDAACYWLDDSTLVALLTVSSAAAPGMTLAVRPGVLSPMAYTCMSSGSADSLCASAQELTVSSLSPCDRATTEEVEQCTKPTAIIQAPTELSSCAQASLTLDASRSTGGGVRPLSYTWRAVTSIGPKPS